jgi:hypothetical protein
MEGDAVVFADLGSTNHSFLNDDELVKNCAARLGTGDVLRVGETAFAVTIVNAADGKIVTAKP